MNQDNANEGAEDLGDVNREPVVQPVAQRRYRPPRDLQGLLRLAIELRANVQGEDNDGPGDMRLDYGREAYLAQALESIMMDAQAVLHNALPILTDPAQISILADKEGLSSSVDAAFYMLLESCEDPYNAEGFCFHNGFTVFSVCYNTRNAELWANTNQLLAVLCQHCEHSQRLAVQKGLLKKLVEITPDPLSSQHRDKCVYAMSSVTRGQSSYCLELVNVGGVEVLVPLLAAEDQRLKNKAARLLYNLLNANPKETRERLIPLNIIKVMVPELDQDKGQHTEQFLALLHTFIDSSEEILAQCKDPDVKFKKVLQNMYLSPSIMDDQEQNREIIEFVSKLLKIFVYDGSGKNTTAYDCEEEADR